ncbi:hypothetical protein SUGI_0731650 [Cryptomeria japonica]|nr:hypothetical protein SUGI_0731650 [Cryptomeria japonica]
MEKYKHLPLPLHLLQKELPDSRRRKPSSDEDDGRSGRTSKKMRLEKEKENANNINNNDSSNSTSSSLQQGQGFSRSSRSPRAGLDPLTSNSHKTLLTNLPPPKGKVVNWRLACFMAREYLSRGTLLGKPWPPQDSNPRQGDETAKEKERLYSVVSTDFLRSDDVHIPGILNPSQLVTWLGFK